MTKLLDIVCETTVSNAHARRLIQQGAVKMNGLRVRDPDLDIGGDVILHIGKTRVISLKGPLTKTGEGR